jgi:hypothetical protein
LERTDASAAAADSPGSSRVAKLGGYIGRNNDPPPGHQLIWQGLTKLQIMAMGFALHEPSRDKDERQLE